MRRCVHANCVKAETDDAAVMIYTSQFSGQVSMKQKADVRAVGVPKPLKYVRELAADLSLLQLLESKFNFYSSHFTDKA